jgi:hypothetical protein
MFDFLFGVFGGAAFLQWLGDIFAALLSLLGGVL